MSDKQRPKIEFELGEMVYLKTDGSQRQRMVTGVIMRPGVCLYSLSSGSQESNHYALEICRERDEVLALTFSMEEE